ncbi:MAG: hypothetical protein JSS63_05375 [Bacteroidetes bacterium]|nr:hypothetical protein [Bacteroidota bacterium]
MHTILELIIGFFAWAIGEIAGLIGISITTGAMDKTRKGLKLPRWLFLLLFIAFVIIIYLGIVYVYRGMKA